MKKTIISLVFLIFATISHACICEQILPISKELSNNYDVIFWGKVDSISVNKKEATAYFTIKKLYKGNSELNAELIYDATSSCLMTFEKNEEWIIYAKYSQFNKLNVHLCSHSRKKIIAPDNDIYFTNAQRTFEQEIDFLKTSLGEQQLIVRNKLIQQQSDFKPHNDQPSNRNKIILLLISVLAMVIVFLISKRFKKK